jgi:hypothetical protein
MKTQHQSKGYREHRKKLKLRKVRRGLKRAKHKK